MMKKPILIGGISAVLLLSVLVGVFVGPALLTSARGIHGKHKHSTRSTTQLAQHLFALINQDRAAQGLPAYTWNATLAQGARQHSKRMAQPQCGLSHQCPGEPDPCQRITNENIAWTECGENAGYTSPYPNGWAAIKHNIEQGMLSEQPPNDGHRQNLLSSTFHKIGIGIYIDARSTIWVTEDFTN